MLSSFNPGLMLQCINALLTKGMPPKICRTEETDACRHNHLPFVRKKEYSANQLRVTLSVL